MKRIICILMVFIVASLNSFAQIADTSFYSNGQPREIKFMQGDKILRAASYEPDGQIHYQWDIPAKELKSYTAITYMDTLAEYFKANCPDYTLFQYFGNGQLIEVVHYVNGKREGTYESYSEDGTPIAKGQFKDWKKTGIWTYYTSDGYSDRQIHWFHHGFYERGISIYYTIIPILLTIVFFLATLFLFLRYSSFVNFFNSYSLFTAGVFVSLILISQISSFETISNRIGKFMFPVLTTLIISNLLLSVSVSVSIFRKRLQVKSFTAILFLVTSIALCLLLAYIYLGAKLSGTILG